MRQQFHSQKGNAKARGIDFLFTFEEWRDWWIATGKWEQRGKGRGKYCMMRKGDTGPYSIDNVFCGLIEKNSSDCHLGAKRTEKTRKRMSESHIGLFTGSKNPRAKAVSTPFGCWQTAKEAAESLGLTLSTVSWRCINNKFGFTYLQGA